MWPDQRIQNLFDITLPIIQAPMAGASYGDMAVAVSQAGGLGSLPCATLSHDQVREEVAFFRTRTDKPINLNFFCHTAPAADAASQASQQAWRELLQLYNCEFGIDPSTPASGANRAPFDDALCGLVEELRPPVVSFHFGLPAQALLDRVKATGAKVLSSATSAEEAVWLAERGCDAIIAQGAEAGGHRGMFMSDEITTQAGLMALLPQIVDAVSVPVIAAGGIGDGRGIAAAFALGAAAVQPGTAYLFCPEARVSAAHRLALMNARDDQTALTNLFTGRPARGLVNRLMREIGPMNAAAPQFPLAGGALTALKNATAEVAPADFTSLWSGQAARLGRVLPAADLTRLLAQEALARLASLAKLQSASAR